MPQVTFNGTKINVEFTESSSRQQLNSGENISTLFGKIKKIFSDLKAVCFSGSYNDLSNKPSSLPANGGNADTVGGKVPEKIFYDNGLAVDLNGATQSGCYATTPDTLNVPFSTWWLVDTMNYNNNQFIVQKAHTLGNTAVTVSYIRNYANDVWSEWEQISTTPIKKISFPSVATNAGGGGSLFLADFGTPITIACTSRADTQCTPFLADIDSGKLWLVLAKDTITLDSIPAGSYSFDVWYI